MRRNPLILFLLACFTIMTGVAYFIIGFNSSIYIAPVESAPTESSQIRLHEKDLEKIIRRYVIGQSIPAASSWALKAQDCTVSCTSARIVIMAELTADVASRVYTDQLTVFLVPYADQGCLFISLQDVYLNRLRLTGLSGLDHCWKNMVLPGFITYQNNCWRIETWQLGQNCSLLQAVVEDHYLVLTVSAK